jgi:hypothetical protein
VLTFRGAADGDEAPVRIIQGPKTQILLPEMVEVDPVNNELFVPAQNKVLVFNRTDQGDVAPKRILNVPANRVAVDYVHNFLVVGGRGARGNQIAIFDRAAAGDTKPLRVIAGPNAPVGGVRHGFDVYSPAGRILVSVPSRGNDPESDLASDASFVGIWSVYDDGDVPPQWTIGGPKGVLRNPRGVTVDAKNKTLIVSDKYLNGVLSYSFPEMFEEATPRPRQTARAEP